VSFSPVEVGVFFFAWFFQAFTGFGAGIFIVGLLSLYHNPKTVIVSSAPVNLFGTLFMFLLLTRRVKPRLDILSLMVFGSVPGIFLGTKTLLYIDKNTLRVVIGAFILLLGIYDLLVQGRVLKSLSLKRTTAGSFFFGFVGGFFAGLIGMGGPPPVVYLNQVLEDVEEFKSTLTLFFTSNILFRLLFYGTEGGMEYFSPYMVYAGAVAIPPAVYVGLLLSKRVEPSRLKALISVSVVLLGIALVYN
jgi:uncharacterized membrane protein YfcA